MSNQYKEAIHFTSKLTLGTKARIIRIAQKWRQTDLATIASVSQANVSAFERDLPLCPSEEKRILEALGLVSDGIQFYKEKISKYKSNPKAISCFEKRLGNLEG